MLLLLMLLLLMLLLLMLLLLMLLLLLLLLLVGAWLWHGSERVGREVAHVDGIVRAVLHICGMFRRGSRECSDGM
jgi:CHASE3 domain sensor protein